MKTYKAYLNQGGGCDYTIGCGIRVINLKSTTLPEAEQELINEIKENYSYSEFRIESCELYELNGVFSVDVKKLYDIIDNEEILRKQHEKEEAEKAEFERLKEKFGK